ncbi:hypothetical protein NX784_11000 [Massilia pinisoli]|uniref:Uncharacterized protein n=1 Tax=Massilia pinisoli TaxID=1772194 RepID=A0ABT1ZQD5_9BURK|nr:hypothetical protein [Massilia pinisoli]MCS0582119.1 hypothetical protein [Massilia pinisoli]
MNLQGMSTKSLLALHNSIAQTSAGPKSFATKAKLIARIEALAAVSNIDLAALCPATTNDLAEQDVRQQVKTTETIAELSEAKKKPIGRGIGRLARELLLDAAGYPYVVIAEMVNTQILGAQTTPKSVRWYACKMRKDGAQVPGRQRPVTERSAATLVFSNKD